MLVWQASSWGLIIIMLIVGPWYTVFAILKAFSKVNRNGFGWP